MAQDQEKVLLGHGPVPVPRKDRSRNIKWIDGLRGVASFSVLITHLTRAFDNWAFMPSNAPGWDARLIQLPFVRVWTQGRIGVAIFAVLTAFVCGIKPLKQIRDDNPQAARDTVAKAAVKRPARLMLPASLATLIAFVVCQFDLFSITQKVEIEWLFYATAQRLPFSEDLDRLQKNLRSTWNNGKNEYDDHQWALLPLLKTSMFIYFTLAVVAGLRLGYRIAVYVVLFTYYWQNPQHDIETFFCLPFYGLLLSDLSQHEPFVLLAQSRSWVRRIASNILIVAGLYVASYPTDHADWMPWSKGLTHLAWLFPSGIDFLWESKRYTAIGLMLSISGLAINNSAKTFLCTRPIQFLGRYSFAVYLTHGTLLKTVMMWMVFGAGGAFDPHKTDGEGKPIKIPRPGPWWIAGCIPIWLALVYLVGWAWTTYVDPMCERVCDCLVRKAFKE